MKPRQFGLYFLSRGFVSGNESKPDGVAILVNEAVFQVIERRDLEYAPYGDRVAMSMELHHIATGCNLVIGNTHFTFPSKYSVEVRRQQCSQFLDLMEDDSATTILCGDYNCSIHESECRECIDRGYTSSYHTVDGDTSSSEGPHQVISHLTHSNQSVFVDHIFYKNTESEFRIEPVDSYLFPRNVASHRWPHKEEWDLSDHRPMVSIFEIASN